MFDLIHFSFGFITPEVVFSVSISALCTTFILSSTLRKAITYFHELCHILGLMITAVILHLEYKHSNITIYPKYIINGTKYPLFSGQTENPIYEYLEKNKSKCYIRGIIQFNALSGSLFMLIGAGLLCFITYKLQYTLFYCCLAILISISIEEIPTFITSSDGKYFICPCSFTYKPKDK